MNKPSDINVFISSQNIDFSKRILELLENKFRVKNISVISSVSSIPEIEESSKIDLIISDNVDYTSELGDVPFLIVSEDVNYTTDKVKLLFVKNNVTMKESILSMEEFKKINKEEYEILNHPDDCLYLYPTFDIMSSPINEDVLINKVSSLINLRRLDNLKICTQVENLCTLIDFSPLYIVIIDSNFKIKAINYSLAREILGDDFDRNSLIGKYWLDFIPESDKAFVKKIHMSLLGQFQLNNETSHNIVNYYNGETKVKWFNSYINTDLKWVFSIGVYDKSKNVSIDDIRDKYMDQILRDRAMIDITKQVALKYSERLLKSKDQNKI